MSRVATFLPHHATRARARALSTEDQRSLRKEKLNGRLHGWRRELSSPAGITQKKSATRSRNQPQMKDAMRWLSREQNRTKSSLKHGSLLQESSRCSLMKTRLSEQNCRTPKHMTTCNVFVCRCLTLVDFSKIQNSNVLMVLASSIE